MPRRGRQSNGCMHAAFRLTCAALCLAAPLAWGAPSGELEAAGSLHRDKRFASSLGRFLNLAEEGDPIASRVVLFMYEHARLLYRAEWEPHEDDVVRWRRQAQQQRPVRDGRRALP